MKLRNNYRPIVAFGSNAYSEVNDPLTYCLGQNMDNKFLHGSSSMVIDGQHSKACQSYLSDYCAKEWDAFCEFGSQNTNTDYPNNLGSCEGFFNNTCLNNNCMTLTAGDILVKNTANKKYLRNMLNCVKQYQPFDPNVASSPLISYWVSDSNCSYNTGSCVPVYAIDPKMIKDLDKDVVMNKVLNKPYIAFDMLVNIYNTMKRENTLKMLKGTRLGNFYENMDYFKAKGGLN